MCIYIYIYMIVTLYQKKYQPTILQIHVSLYPPSHWISWMDRSPCRPCTICVVYLRVDTLVHEILQDV